MGIKNYKDLPRVYLDMDGVLADFDLAMQLTGLPAKELKLIPGTYINLEPVPRARSYVKTLVKELEDSVEFWVCTKIPSANPYSASEKLIWIVKYFPCLEDRIIITPDKGCVGTTRDTLVDDFPEWANAGNFTGEVIPFGIRHGLHWDQLYKRLKKKFN